MKFISLFAGIGGLDLGLERAGMECVAQVEIDDFCQKVLAKNFPNVPKFKDVRDVGKHNLPAADLICGGFPCQDVSLAGERAGLEGKRSTLWSEFHRIVCEIQPRWVVIENVFGLLSSDDGEFFTKIFRELSSSGYDAEWRVVSASDLGAPHQRERLFIVAYSNGSAQPPEADEWQEYVGNDWGSVWDVATTGNRTNPEWQTHWQEVASQLCRMDDGLSAGLDKPRLKALGNAVVPQVAEFIGSCIMQSEVTA